MNENKTKNVELTLMSLRLAKAEMFFKIPRCRANLLIALTTWTPFMFAGTAQFYHTINSFENKHN